MSRQRPTFGGAGDVSIARRRTGSDADLDITPMIEVTFLLLIFFMEPSTMNPTREVDVPPAEFGVGISANESTVITVRPPQDNAPPLVELGEGTGEFVGLDDVPAFVEREAGEGRNQIIIKADRDAPHGFVQQVARQVKSVDGVQMSFEFQDTPS